MQTRFIHLFPDSRENSEKSRKRFNLETDGSQNGWDNYVPGGPECWIYVDGKLRGPEEVSAPNRCPDAARSWDRDGPKLSAWW